VGGVCDVEVDPGDIGEVPPVLVPLVEEVAAVVEAGGGAARVVIEDQVGVLVGLGLGGLDGLRFSSRAAPRACSRRV
jgi:hypothetical protein